MVCASSARPNANSGQRTAARAADAAQPRWRSMTGREDAATTAPAAVRSSADT